MSTPPRLLGLLLLSTHCLTASGQDAPVIRITPQSSPAASTTSLRGLAVRSEREAWATGTLGTVLRTTNGGDRWTRVMVPESAELDFRDIELLPNGVVLLMSAGSGPASRVLRSSDNGRTWQVVLQNTLEAGFYDGMAFVDQRTGLLMGDPTDGRLDLYRTRDGGQTWGRLLADQRPSVMAGEYGFAASGTGVAASEGTIWIGTGGAVARVFRSQDLGRTWHVAQTTISSGTESSGIFSLGFSSAERGVAIGGDYRNPQRAERNVAATADGGRTWKVNDQTSMPHKACVRALKNGAWLAVGRTGVAVSSDGGQTWKHISQESYYTCDVAPSGTTAYLAGAGGRVARVEIGSLSN